MSKKRLKRDNLALDSLVNRAESALSLLAEWYCADVGCGKCRVGCGCDRVNRVLDAAYDKAVADERVEERPQYKHVRGGEVWWDDNPEGAE